MQVTTDRGGTDGILSAIQSLPMETFTIRDVRAARPGAANSSLYAAIKAARDSGIIEKAGVAFPDPGGPGMTSYRIKDASSNPEGEESPPLASGTDEPSLQTVSPLFDKTSGAAKVREIVATLEQGTEFYAGEILKRGPELSYPIVKAALEFLSKRGVLTVTYDRTKNIKRSRYRVEDLSLLVAMQKKKVSSSSNSENLSGPLAPNENLSARVREYVRGMGGGAEFTASQIAALIPGADISGISSALSYAASRGMVVVLGRRKGAHGRYTAQYRVADLSVRINSSAESHGGSKPGRLENGRVRRELPILPSEPLPTTEAAPPLPPCPVVTEPPWARLTPATLSQQLLDLAALAEGLKPDLARATDEELMAELHRRISLKKE